MELVTATTPIAQWLNSFFEAYDYAILDFLNTLANGKLGGILTSLMKAISLLGEKGIIFFILAAILMIFPKTRKTGVCVFGAVCCGALITNIILKDLVARPRPFEANEIFRSFWDAVGSPAEDDFSFPSGHVTGAAAGMAALCWARGKKFVLPGILWVGLMMTSRNYLVAHYPSDVLFSVLIGVFSATVAWFITLLIFKILTKNRDKRLCYLLLNAGPGGNAEDESEEENYDERPVQRKSVKRVVPKDDEEDVKVFRKTRKEPERELSELAPRKEVRTGEYRGRHEK